MRVLKADISWGWDVCCVICSFRRRLSLALPILLLQIGKTQDIPPAPERWGRSGPGPARGQGVTWSGRRCPPPQRFLAGEGRGTAGLAPGGWDRSLPAGTELEKPVVGSGRASSCRSSFPSAAAVPAPLSALLGALEAGLRQASLCATEGSVAAPAGAKLSVPGLKGKPLPERKIKLIQKAGASSGAQGSPPGNRRRMKGPGSLVCACLPPL